MIAGCKNGQGNSTISMILLSVGLIQSFMLVSFYLNVKQLRKLNLDCQICGIFDIVISREVFKPLIYS